MKYHFETSSEQDDQAWQGELPVLRVAFILAPEFTLLPMAGFVDVLRLAADRADDSRQVHCQWDFLSHNDVPIRSSCGVEIQPTARYDDAGCYDYTVVVGGRLKVHHLHAPETFDYLKAVYEHGGTLVALCSGAFVLAQAGVLQGHRVCCHYAVKAQLLETYPELDLVTDVNYLEDGKLISCPGSIAAIDLAIHLVSRCCSRAQAVKASHYMLVEPEGGYFDETDDSVNWQRVNSDPRLLSSVRLMQMHIDTPLTVSELAARAGTTERNLHRLFSRELGRSPSEVQRLLRLEHARNLLLQTERAVTRIALDCGFMDNAHFSRAFKARYGLPPKQYRLSQRD